MIFTPCSLVKVEIITSGGLVSYHLFVGNDSDLEFTLGRANTCDIVISQNTISREQCRFIFQPNLAKRRIWCLRDGCEQRESSNGTWLCLTDYRLRSFKQESEMVRLRQGQEIKISDTILKVEWNNQQE